MAADISSQARYLFEQYTGPDALAKLLALPAQEPRAFETNWLEFKSGKTREEDIRPHWSKALGAFANSGGGVVVWGIRADRDADLPIDVVKEVVCVPDVNKLAAKLRELHPVVTDPPIKGVEVYPLLVSDSSLEGFVICYIPESDAKPHRSEFSKPSKSEETKGTVKRFNLRIGDSTQECNVPLLRQLFFPKIAPRLQIGLRAIHPPQSIPYMFLSALHGGSVIRQDFVNLLIKNLGPSSFHEAAFNLSCEGSFLTSYNCTPSKQASDVQTFEGPYPFVRPIHPGQTKSFNFFTSIFAGKPTPKWEFVFYARDLMPKIATVTHDLVMQEPWSEQIVECL